MRNKLTRQILGTLLGLCFTWQASGAGKQSQGVDHGGEVDKSTCRFAPEYRRIRSNKADPRVAFIELSKFAYKDKSLANEIADFDSTCKIVSNQIGGLLSIFDRAHGYFMAQNDQVDMGLDRTVAFFSEHSPKPGIILFVDRDSTTSVPLVFSYRNSSWQNVTSEYLGPFHLSEHDYIVVPQYGRTARVMTIDPKDATLRHNFWLHWDGVKFQRTETKPSDWRCPAEYERERHIDGTKDAAAICSN